jgi:predicted Rossmann-fold nucleotide-binding protein
VVVNVNGYWSNLRDMMAEIVAKGFAHPGHEALITVVERAEEAIAAVEAELEAPKPAVLFKV